MITGGGDPVSTEHDPGRLARRLRSLREEAWSGVTLTQAQLAQALSSQRPLKASMISTWESAANSKAPNSDRLRAYARFFATRRSIIDGPRLVPDHELTDSENEARASLEIELLGLLETGPEHLPGAFAYAEGPINIICPDAPKKGRSPLADEVHPDFTKLLRYSDLDALVELHGHVRAANPNLDVFHRLASEARADDLSAHLILLGGITWSPMLRRIQNAITRVPIRQIAVPGAAIDPFSVDTKGTTTVFEPIWERPEEDRVLVEDVAYLARIPNPFNSSRTLTICNGIQSRGVLGAVRCLTDARLRNANERYLADRHPGGSFALLLRVPVLNGEVMSPDLTIPHNRLHEWPSLAGDDE